MKFRLLAIALFLISYTVSAQREVGEESSFFDRVYLGGNFGAQFGTTTFIDVSPLAGYMITDKLSAGVGITYQFLKYKPAPSVSFSTSIYGWRTFVRRNIGRQFFAHGEFENINLELYAPSVPEGYRREWVPGLFIGGGLFQPIGKRAGFMISALYNVMYDDIRSPYNSPLVLRVGFTL